MSHKTPKFRRSVLARSVLIACGATAAVLVMNPAMSQTQSTLQRVEVTGSNIPRADKETPSPVQVITSEELKASGFTTVNEVLQNLTSNGQGTLGKGFDRAFAAGASGISLRGLTLGSTLILIDGHRMAPYPMADDAQRFFVDISSIPFASIERIEVLKDGASAVYGSDAIAGVVNVILKRTYEGTSISAETGTTQKGGGTTRNVSIAHGFGKADEINGYVALEVRHGDPVRVNQRSGDWARMDWRPEGGLDLRPGSRNALVGSPRVQAGPILQIPGSSATNAANFVFPAGCTHAQWRASQCQFEDTWSQLQPETDNINLIGRVNTKLGSDWDLRLTGSRFESKTKVAQTQQVFPNGTAAPITSIGLGQAPANINGISPFTVPATYPGNTLGVAANVIGFVPDFTNRTNNVKTVATRLAAEVTGEIAGWDTNTAVGYTKVETTRTFSGYINQVALNAALNDPINPFLIYGGNTQANLNRVAPDDSVVGTSELTFLDARATRELMALPGGPLSLGAGYSYNYINFNSPGSNGAVKGVTTANGAYAAGKTTSNAVFLELVAPVTKSLELDAAVRHDRYDSGSNSTTPKLAFKFTPIKEVTFRGTTSRGFRQPGAAESGEAGSVFGFNTIRDPLNCPDLNPDGTPNLTSPRNVVSQCSFRPAYLQATTKTLEPEKSKSMTFGLILEPIPNWSSTLDYYKVTIDGQIISESSTPSYTPLNYIVRGTPQNVIFGDGRTGLSPFPTIQYATTGYVNGNTTSTSGVEFETKYKFKLPEASSLTVGLQLSRVLEYSMIIGGVESQLAGTHGPNAVGGNTGNPKDRAQITLTYQGGPWTVNTSTNYVSGFDLTDPSASSYTCAEGVDHNTAFFANDPTLTPSKYCSVPSFVSTNLSVKYQYSKGLTLRAAVQNLFGVEPPVDFGTYGAAGTNASSAGAGLPYNPSLHQAGAIGRFVSIGLDYKF